MLITPGDDKYETDVKSVGGYRFSIKTTTTGYYKIDAEGPGQKPAICDELFTNLRSVRIALDKYIMDNQATLNKQAVIERVAGPKPERYKKK